VLRSLVCDTVVERIQRMTTRIQYYMVMGREGITYQQREGEGRGGENE
jgi:hypothetical protein